MNSEHRPPDHCRAVRIAIQHVVAKLNLASPIIVSSERDRELMTVHIGERISPATNPHPKRIRWLFTVHLRKSKVEVENLGKDHAGNGSAAAAEAARAMLAAFDYVCKSTSTKLLRNSEECTEFEIRRLSVHRGYAFQFIRFPYTPGGHSRVEVSEDLRTLAIVAGK